MVKKQFAFLLFFCTLFLVACDFKIPTGPGTSTNSSSRPSSSRSSRISSSSISSSSIDKSTSGKKNADAIQDNSFIAGTAWFGSSDNSYWTFREDDTFSWYQSKSVQDDNYYAGTYKFYHGEDALTYLTVDLSSFGVTEDEILNNITLNGERSLENFICFSTNNESFLLNSVEQLSKPYETYYYGFIDNDKSSIYLVNMQTGSVYNFSRETV